MAKKILVPGAGIGQEMVLRKAREMGLTTVVVSPEGAYPGFAHADIVYHEDVRNQERVLEIAQAERIDGIVSDQNDIPVETMGFVAEKMELTGNSLDTSRRYSRKDWMRSTCREIGVPSPAWGVATDVEGGREIAGEIGYPLMCKPTDNQSSKGVFRVRDEEELVRVFPEALANAFSGKVILEEYLRGPEYIVDGLAIRGVYRSLLLLENENFSRSEVCIPRGRTFPTGLPDDKIWELLMLDREINTSFGLSNGLSHNEYLLNPKDDQFYLIDAAARGGGAFISSHLLPFACRFDAAEMLVRLALGEELDIQDYSPGSKAVSYLCFYLTEGVIRQIKGLDQIKDMDCVLGVHEANLEPGMSTKGLLDKSYRLGPILIGCETLAELNRARRTIRDTLVISTDHSENAVIWE
jgi:carbamoyl-phosphate synthase large subunit